ncbi:hypothetical protein MNV_2180005 [Candidatus Methanoperedens nitroreducens]|uniref:Uncharacterized protein n=1 Tax=Candidatus Methanoperedens nitratireducens TaxID=1392998 RepID=A0A284VP15_9EURY|nr:hypothetical protein MNV_2180005 [Candidatus Methanoperedens nitroreducens]
MIIPHRVKKVNDLIKTRIKLPISRAGKRIRYQVVYVYDLNTIIIFIVRIAYVFFRDRYSDFKVYPCFAVFAGGLSLFSYSEARK